MMSEITVNQSVQSKDTYRLNLLKAVESWLGVPYHYNYNGKMGIDCRFFVVRLLGDAGIEIPNRLVSKFFSSNWYIHHTGPDPYLEWFNSFGFPIKEDDVCVGDFILFNTVSKRYVTHSGVSVGGGKFIHCLEGSGVAMNAWNDRRWIKRINSFYRLRVVEELS